eukprot:1944412-Pyramimonas_sp.AAC.1
MSGRKNKRFAGGGRLPLRENANGEPAQTQEEADEAMLRHFAKAEDADVMGKTAVEELYHKRKNDYADTFMQDIETVPTRYDIQQSYKTTKRRRAAGPDNILDDVLRATAKSPARWRHPVYFKTALYLQEPIAFKEATFCGMPKSGPS